MTKQDASKLRVCDRITDSGLVGSFGTVIGTSFCGVVVKWDCNTIVPYDWRDMKSMRRIKV